MARKSIAQEIYSKAQQERYQRAYRYGNSGDWAIGATARELADRHPERIHYAPLGHPDVDVWGHEFGFSDGSMLTVSTPQDLSDGHYIVFATGIPGPTLKRNRSRNLDVDDDEIPF